MAKSVKALAFTISWGTPQHFLKTYFCLESRLSYIFLELQKSLQVIFRHAEHYG